MNDDPICERIRVRRSHLGLSLARLAATAGLRSAAYVLYIETGKRVPSESVARRLAAALGDDPELFAAWARTRSRGDLAGALDGARTLERLLGRQTPERTDRGESRQPQIPPTTAEPTAPGRIIDVPVLREGSPPGDDASPAIETLRLDTGAFPPGPPPTSPFAYRLSAHGARPVSDALRPGDCVVLSREVDAPMDDAIYAIRFGARVELGRVRVVDGVLHVLRGATTPDLEAVPTAPGAEALAAIVGKVVLALRRWL